MLHWILPGSPPTSLSCRSRAFVSNRGVGVCLDVAEAGGALRANGSLENIFEFLLVKPRSAAQLRAYGELQQAMRGGHPEIRATRP